MTKCRIIIVNYNSGGWLSRCLASAVAYSDANITVVDNASLDDSVSQAKQRHANNSRIDWIQNQRNVGFAAANNQVLNHLQEPFAILLNPDCELRQTTVAAMQTAFAHNQQLGLASCYIVNEAGEVDATCKRRFPTPWSSLVRLLQLRKCFPNHPAFADFDCGQQERDTRTNIEYLEAISGAFMMVRKTAMDEVGVLDEAYFMHCEDLDWCKRFSLSEWQVGFINNTQVLHARGVSSATRPIRVLWTLHKGMARFCDKFYASQYGFLSRIFIKLGIAASFVLRVCALWVKQLRAYIRKRGG